MATIRSRKHANASHLLALVAAALPVAAQAQEAAKEASLPAMTVKATVDVPFKAETSANPKFTQKLVDTPQTVQVIKKEIIQEQGAASLMEALRNTPGITMQLGENGNTAAGDTFMMRGFSTESATFVDGIRDVSPIARDVFNLDQIEVVKGPAGADIGRGAASGYINLISKLPTRDSVNAASVAVGTANKLRTTADINQAIGETAAVRLNVMAQQGGVDGRNVVENQGYAIAPAFALGLGTPTRFYFYSQHVRQDNIPDGGIPTVGMAGFYDASAAIRQGGKVNRENFYGSPSDYEKVQSDMVTAKIEHDLGNGTTIRNITRYGKSTLDRVLTGVASGSTPITAVNANDPSTWTVNRTRQRIDQTNEILANQTNLTTKFKTAGLEHDLSAGVELMYERQKNLSFGTTAQTINGVSYAAVAIPNANLYGPNTGDTLGKPYATGAYTDGQTLTSAFYVFDTLKLNEAFQLSGGLRYEHYNTSTDGRTLVTSGSSGNIANYPGYSAGQLAPDSLKDSGNLLSWKVGALYKPAENGSIYAAYATSYTPPGSANFALAVSSSSSSRAGLDPQETKNIELGTKWELLNKRLNLNAAVYRTENDKQVSYNALDASYSQFGKTRVQGVELSAVGQLTNFWQLSAGIAKMSTKAIDNYSFSSSSNATTQSSGVRWSPDLTATLWSSYTLGDFTLGGGVRYVSDQKRLVAAGQSEATTNMPKIPSYWVTDMMAAYAVSKQLNLRLNVYNLFDKEYISTLNNGGGRMTLGQPRSAMLTANFQF